MVERFQVAIDGPGGAGKSTMARALARRCALNYVDTGATFRAAALALLQAGAVPEDPEGVAALLPELRLSVRYDGEGLQHTLLDGTDVNPLLRTPEVTAAASAFSALPAVRAYLLPIQRGLTENGRIVMDGRDIGTVVLPDAELKIFLTAAAETRALRRTQELAAAGKPQPYEAVLREMNERDARDSSRAAAPLRMAADAMLVDTTHLSEAETVELLVRMVQERMKAR